MEVIKLYLKSRLEVSLATTVRPVREPDPDAEPDDAANERRHLISLIDEHCHDRANKFLEKCYEIKKLKALAR